jgi:hypothetical protein
MRDIKDVIREFRKRERLSNPVFNVNTVYDTLAKRMSAAEAALKLTPYGRGGLIKLEPESTDPGSKIKFVIATTGQKMDTMEDAVDEVNQMAIADVKVFGKRTSFVPDSLSKAMERASRSSDNYGAARNIFEDMHTKLRSLSSDDLEVLRKANINVGDLSDLELRLYTMEKKGSPSELIAQIQRMQQSGMVDGIVMPDDEGARILSLVNGGKSLDTYQTNLILSMTGHGFYDEGDLLDALGPSSTGERTGEALAKMVEKIGKRQRAYLAPREISLAGDELSDLVKKFSKSTKSKLGQSGRLSDITLFVDPEYEILKKFAHGRHYNFDGNKALQAYYKSMNADKEVRGILGSFTENALTQSETSELQQAITNFPGGTGNKFLGKELKEHLKAGFAVSDPSRSATRSAAIEGLFESIEKSFDGADIMNKKFLNTYIAQLRAQKKDIATQLGSTSDAHKKQKALAIMSELDDKIARLSSGDYSQVTGRGRTYTGAVDRFLNIKNAFGLDSKFDPNLEGYAMVISRHSVKGESGIAGDIESLILSGIGRKNETVYVDPVAAAFNAQLFTDPGSIDIIKRNQDEVVQQFRESIESGIVPEKLRKMLEYQASADIESLPVSKRLSGARNKEFAQSIMDMLHSGASPKDSPYLMSLLHTATATMAFKEKGYGNGVSFFEPALPETHRFAINTERGLMGTTDAGYLLGNSRNGSYGFETLDLFGSGGNRMSTDALKFRIKGHTMFIPNIAVGQFHHSLGGFDLDDKGIARTVTFEDSAGMKRLGFLSFRQPSGPEEFIFMRMNMDQESIKSMFGNDRFKNALAAIMQENAQNNITGADAAKFAQLQDVIEFTPTKGNRTLRIKNPDEIESAIVAVSERVGNSYTLTREGMARFAESGSSTLMLTDLVDKSGKKIIPEYTQRGVYKAFLESGAKFDMSEDIQSLLASPNISNELRSSLSSATDFNSMLEVLANHSDSRESSALIASALDKMTLKKIEQNSGNLGMYVNRSGIVGSTLDQYSAFLENASQSVRDYLLNPENINYSAGLIAQEEGIDLTVNLSTSKTVNLGVQQYLTNNMGVLDETKVSKAILDLYKTAGTKSAVSLNTIGEAAISSLGRRIGFTRAIGSTNQNTIAGIDEFLLKNKMNAGDRQRLLEDIIAGMEDAMQGTSSGAFQAVAARADIEAELQQYKKALVGDDKQIEDVLMKNVALSRDHAFASLSKLDYLARQTDVYLDTIRKKGLTGLKSNPVLALAQSSVAEDSLARYIVQKHGQDLATVSAMTSKVLKEGSALELYNWTAKINQIGENVLGDIHAASQVSGVEKKGLFNALDKLGAEAGFDIGALRFVAEAVGVDSMSDTAAATHFDIMANRQLRRLDHLRSLDQANAQSVLSIMGHGPANKLKADNLKDVADALIAPGSGTTLTDLQSNTLKALSERSSEITDNAARQQAVQQADVVRARLEYERLSAEGIKSPFSDVAEDLASVSQRLDAQGTISDLAQTVGAPDLARIEKEMIESVGIGESAVPTMFTPAKYKRFALKDIQEGGKYFDLISSPGMKKGLIGMSALIVGSFAYKAYKNRTHDDMSGPPLLPGGSAYEGGMPTRIPNLGSPDMGGYNPGINYNVSLYGDRKSVSEFNKQAGGLVNGNISTTMYNRIADVGRNPYGSLASSY